MNEEKCGECAVIGSTPIKNGNLLSNDTTKLVGIYGLRNKVNGKWYIGQSVDIKQRWRAYERLKCKKQRKLYAALLKYGFQSFDVIIVEECENLNERETFWIKEYDAIENGYNICEGGSSGRKSEETKRRMSESAKKRGPLTEDIKNIISNLAKERMSRYNPHTGMKRSEETRRKISEAAKERYKDPTKNPNFGKHHSEEAKRKMSVAAKRRYKKEPV